MLGYDGGVRLRFFLVASAAAAAFAGAAACSPFAADDPLSTGDAGPGVDAAPVSPVGHGSILCVTEATLPPPSCPAGQACCVTWGSGVIFDKCVAPDAPPCGGNSPSTKLSCDEQSDCSPNVCCRFDLVSPSRFEAYCVKPEDCSAPNHPMCSTNSDCDRDPNKECKSVVIGKDTLVVKSCQ